MLGLDFDTGSWSPASCDPLDSPSASLHISPDALSVARLALLRAARSHPIPPPCFTLIPLRSPIRVSTPSCVGYTTPVQIPYLIIPFLKSRVDILVLPGT